MGSSSSSRSGFWQQQLGQRDAALLAAGEVRDAGVAGRGAQGIHRLLELGVEVPGIRGVDVLLQHAHLGQQRVEVGIRLRHRERDLVEAVELGLDRSDALLHVLEHGLGLVELGLLHEDADGVARGQLGFAVARGVEPGHDLQDRRLAGAVRADHADLRAGVERHRDVVEDELVADRFAGAHHRVDVFGHGVKSISPSRTSPTRGDSLSTGRVRGAEQALSVGDDGPGEAVVAHDPGLADQAGARRTGSRTGCCRPAGSPTSCRA